MRRQSKPESEEARQCDIRLRALQEQQTVLYARLHERVVVSAEQVQRNREEEQSLVEIQMETEEVVDTEMDTTIIEQGTLPKASGSPEQQVYKRLVTYELNPIQWRFKALLYLASIVKVNR